MMRMAILLLIVANIVLFLWLHAPQSPEPAVATLPDPEVGRLILASEAEPGRPETPGQAVGDPAAVSPTAEQEVERRSVQDAPAQPTLVEDSSEPPADPVTADDRTGSPSAITPQAEDTVSVDLASLSERLEVLETRIYEDPQKPASDSDTATVAPDVDVTDVEVVSEADSSTGETASVVGPRPAVDATSVLGEPSTDDADMAVVRAMPAAQAAIVADAEEEAEVAEEAAGPGITASGPPADEEAATPSGPETAVVPSAENVPTLRPSVCARVGPLSDDEAEALIKALPVYVRLLSDVSEEYTEIDRYYVMIPALPSRAEGRQKLAALEAAGFSDTWLFPSGQYRNAISLGFFRYEPRAARHADRVRSAGFDAIVEPRVSRREGRWLTVENVDGGAIELTLPLPETASVSPRPCAGE